MLPRLSIVLYRLARNQRGVTMVEYALLVALLSLAIAAMLNSVAQKIQGVFTTATSAMI